MRTGESFLFVFVDRLRFSTEHPLTRRFPLRKILKASRKLHRARPNHRRRSPKRRRRKKRRLLKKHHRHQRKRRKRRRRRVPRQKRKRKRRPTPSPKKSPSPTPVPPAEEPTRHRARHHPHLPPRRWLPLGQRLRAAPFHRSKLRSQDLLAIRVTNRRRRPDTASRLVVLVAARS